jgi:hypothetical protein
MSSQSITSSSSTSSHWEIVLQLLYYTTFLTRFSNTFPQPHVPRGGGGRGGQTKAREEAKTIIPGGRCAVGPKVATSAPRSSQSLASSVSVEFTISAATTCKMKTYLNGKLLDLSPVPAFGLLIISISLASAAMLVSSHSKGEILS